MCSSTYKMAVSIRTKQTESLKRMINLNDTPRKTASSEPVWKVLVYDRYGQDIISPLLTVAELRELGVTLHLLLHSDRDSIPDVPAIYFVLPTEENIKRICQDCRNQCYESYYLNFITAIMRRQLEDLASAVLQGDCVTQISKVFDQYLNFISLEENMFTTRYQERDSISYYALNRPDAKDTDIESIRDTLVDSLFSFLVTLGTVPVIRCPRGNAAEIVSEALDKKLRENLRDARNSLFAGDMSSGQFSFQRPVLIILDRNIDLCTPLHHTWTYQALCHDVLDLHLNRVIIKESAPDNGPTEHGHSRPKPVKTKSYDLSATDNFWNNHRGSPFPNVAESIQKELDEYKASEGEVKRLKSIMGLDDSDEGAISDLMNDHTSKLTSAVSSLPELLEKKRLIDQHTNIATALLDQIKHRHLDTYFESEEKIMSNQRLDKSVLEFIQDPEAGTPEDKLRLFMIFYISGPTMSAAEFDQYSSALQDAGADLSALNYIKKWKAFTKITTGPVQSGGGGQNTYSAMFSKIIGTSSQFVMEGVKNLVVGNKNLPVTRIVDAIMEIKSTAPDVEGYRYFDPKMLRATDSSSIPRNKTPFQEAIVFVVGGGNYIEYQNLVDYAMRNPSNPKTIVYGASEIFNASQFVKQLEVLGRDPPS